jgi:hypothetical protein
MTNQSPYSWYNAQPASAPGASPSVTEVDARVRGGLMVVCEFKGHDASADVNYMINHHSVGAVCIIMKRSQQVSVIILHERG